MITDFKNFVLSENLKSSEYVNDLYNIVEDFINSNKSLMVLVTNSGGAGIVNLLKNDKRVNIISGVVKQGFTNNLKGVNILMPNHAGISLETFGEELETFAKNGKSKLILYGYAEDEFITDFKNIKNSYVFDGFV